MRVRVRTSIGNQSIRRAGVLVGSAVLIASVLGSSSAIAEETKAPARPNTGLVEAGHSDNDDTQDTPDTASATTVAVAEEEPYDVAMSPSIGGGSTPLSVGVVSALGIVYAAILWYPDGLATPDTTRFGSEFRVERATDGTFVLVYPSRDGRMARVNLPR